MVSDLGAALESGCAESWPIQATPSMTGGKNSTVIPERSSSRDELRRERISSVKDDALRPEISTLVESAESAKDSLEERHEHIADKSNMVSSMIRDRIS